MFYVLRSLLRVGTLRAQYSKCHSRHFFISPTRKRPLKKLYKGITKNTINNNTRMCMRVDNPPKFGRRLCEKIPCLCHHRRTSSEVACKKKLAREFGLPHFLLFPQIRNLREPCLIGYLCGSSPMKKTILDLLHSLGVEDDLMMLDDIGG